MLQFEYLPCVNYAMYHNQVPICCSLAITNNDEQSWHTVKISVTGEFMKPNDVNLDMVPPAQQIIIDKIEIIPDHSRLLALTEGVRSEFKLTITQGDKTIYDKNYPIYLMAYDQWSGSGIRPELLAAFVTPNHPLLSRVSVNASTFLQKWTNSSALDEYQTQNPNRVRLQVAAIYEALRSESLVYCTSPASYENYGQRVRMVDKVLSEKLGTCLDLTLLFASCLEANGIHPILVLVKGHIFVGAWLVPDMYIKSIGDDQAFLLKECSDGINEIVIVETTLLASSEPVSFEQATTAALNSLRQEDNFEMFIDVKHCRLDGVRPLPQIKQDGVWDVENKGIEHTNATEKVNQLSRYDLKLDETETVVTKQTIWERKLLDFSLRNNLINMRPGKRLIPFISYHIDRLEDHLQAGENYQILPNPVRGRLEPDKSGIYNSQLYVQQLEELILQDLKNKKLHSYQTDSELENSLKYLYRQSRTALEENGANALFLVLGIMKWYETVKSEMPRFAPILLLPVEIIRKGGTKGYVIRTRDEDIIINITIVELLKQQYNIKLAGLNPLPKDESGVDVKKIFTIIRTCIKEQKGWDVIEESMLGIFSFNKFVMWNDIHSNSDQMKENPIIASLMENRITWEDNIPEADARLSDKNDVPTTYAIPVDVDSSQLEAIIESGSGKSFILHGPPGTGKSQTITNMIANSLYQGKRVLFVAEKMAALSVVQTRLSRIGLEPFCLELHSNKVTKTHFLKQMEMALNVVHVKSPDEYQRVSEELFAKRKQLIGYMEALHHTHSSGLSLFDCISGYLSIPEDEMHLCLDKLGEISLYDIEKYSETLEKCDTVFKITGHPSVNPLNGLYPIVCDQQSNTKLSVLLSKYLMYISEIWPDCIKDAENLFGIQISDDIAGLETLSSFIENLIDLPVYNARLYNLSTSQGRIQELKEIINTGKARDELYNSIVKTCSPEIFNENSYALNEEWKKIGTKWFIPRYFSMKAFMKKMRLYSPDMSPCDVEPLLKNLLTRSKYAKQVNEESSELFDLFGNIAKSEKEKWEIITTVLEIIPGVFADLCRLANQTGTDVSVILNHIFDKSGNNWDAYIQINKSKLQRMRDCHKQLVLLQKELATITNMELPDTDISKTHKEKIQKWIGNLSGINDWYLWCLKRSEMKNHGLQIAIDYIEKEGKSGQQAAKAFMKGLYHQLANKYIESQGMLRLFNGLLFDEQISKYKELTDCFQELSKLELYSRLAGRIPCLTMEAAANSEVGILKRNISNGGRGTSIRKIIDQIPTLLPKLCPCMLMSPISVAQYIDLNNEKFDIVIFDEASQMPTSEAVGAIARGKALVVVGDPKQMPPTNFFSTSQVDDDEADLDDLESILDDCISLSMPSRYLTWHYRSKHESLIAFSNSQYYNGKLYTFPSVDDRQSKVSLVRVDGEYDKGRTRSNRIEAIAVVNEVLRRLSDPLSQRSIGIVSFSKVQQNLIEDILIEELAKNPELEEKAYQGDEPIFIKNLENVQGDERDVILFSIGYGPDKAGKVSMNFGPLNNSGGERRLNVAVSRARYEMIVYSSLRSDQIDLKRTKAAGVEGLKRFLEFAEKGVTIVQSTQVSSNENNCLIEQLAMELEKIGYQTDTYIGRSEFKVDLAVVNPDNPNEYILGILCDSKNYYNTKTTRDREIVQPGVLKMLHWNILRVWSVDWYTHKEQTLSTILDKLESLKEKTAEQTKEIQTDTRLKKKFTVENLVIEDNDDRKKVYEFANLDHIQPIYDIEDFLNSSDIVKQVLYDIIAVEQPITASLLCDRITKAYSLGRVTSRIQNFINTALEEAYKEPENYNKTNVYWKNEESTKDYSTFRTESHRDIQDIPVCEIMNAVKYAIEQQISMPENDLRKVTSKLLGFSRMGTNLEASIGLAISILIKKGTLKSENGMIIFA